jgi:hypothetical protein
MVVELILERGRGLTYQGSDPYTRARAGHSEFRH